MAAHGVFERWPLLVAAPSVRSGGAVSWRFELVDGGGRARAGRRAGGDRRTGSDAARPARQGRLEDVKKVLTDKDAMTMSCPG